MSYMTPDELRAWAKTAKPGDKLAYHVGQHFGGASAGKGHPRQRLFSEARQLFHEGRVALTQKVVGGETVFEFIATRISPKTAETLDKVSLSVWPR